MRTCYLTKIVSSVLVLGLMLVMAEHSFAQQRVTAENDEIGTIGDISVSKLRPQIRSLPGLNFSTLGLFGDSEVYPNYNPPAPFIFPLPNFGSTMDFSDWTYNEYLKFVAASYDLSSADDYQLRFTYQIYDEYTQQINDLMNWFSDLGDLSQYSTKVQDELISRYQSEYSAITADYQSKNFATVHMNDFMAGGGFIKFDENTDDHTLPGWPGLTPNNMGGTTTDETTDTGDAATQAAAVVAVPEPATLGLLTLGITMLLARSHKY